MGNSTVAEACGFLSATKQKLALAAGSAMVVYVVLLTIRMFVTSTGNGNVVFRSVIAVNYLLAVFLYFLFFRKQHPALSWAFLLLTMVATGFFAYEVWVLYSEVTNFAVAYVAPRVSQVVFPLSNLPLAVILWQQRQIPTAFAVLHGAFAVVWLSMYFFVDQVPVLVDLAFFCDALGAAAVGGFALWLMAIGAGIFEWEPDNTPVSTKRSWLCAKPEVVPDA